MERSSCKSKGVYIYIYFFLFKNLFYWSIADLQCVNFCCTAKWFNYTCIYILFYILLHYGLSLRQWIIEYHSLCYTIGPCCLHLVAPSSQSIPPLPLDQTILIRVIHVFSEWQEQNTRNNRCIFGVLMEYYSAIKKNEIMSFEATWMQLKIIILSEVSQKEKDKYHMISLICGM